MFGSVSISSSCSMKLMSTSSVRMFSCIKRALAIFHLTCEAIERLQQVFSVIGNEINQLGFERLFGSDGCRVIDHCFGKFYGFLAAILHQRARFGFQRFLDLALQRGFNICAGTLYRACRADDRVGRHCRGVTRHCDQRARAACNGIFRRNVDHHRHCAGTNLLDDFQHGIHTSAGGVQLDDEQFRVALFGGFYPALDSTPASAA